MRPNLNIWVALCLRDWFTKPQNHCSSPIKHKHALFFFLRVNSSAVVITGVCSIDSETFADHMAYFMMTFASREDSSKICPPPPPHPYPFLQFSHLRHLTFEVALNEHLTSPSSALHWTTTRNKAYLTFWTFTVIRILLLPKHFHAKPAEWQV